MFRVVIGCLLLSATAFSQIVPTKALEIQNALDQKHALAESSRVKNIPFANIGPSIMSGRVVDVAVNPKNTVEFYVAYASGGLWHTQNNGTSFEPILDGSDTQNIGDIAVHWPSKTLWVGTGENNSSRSSYAGIGLLKSADNGKTWKSMGLADTHHIGRIIVNPKNPDEIIVGATGHLYSENESRGVYKSTDGGATWEKTLFVSAKTGIIDLACSPNNFDIQYAAAWQKDRKAWDFVGNGAESAIYKSTDAGTTWTLITKPESGFPTGKGVGRIGLAVVNDDIVYAVHDNQFRRKKTKEDKKKKEDLSKDDFKTMTVGDFLKIKDEKLNTFLKANGFQEKYRAENVKQLVRAGTAKPADIAKYLETANSLLFDTPVIGAEVYRSDDGGTTWNKQNEEYIDDLFYSYGYYFAQIRVDPNNQEKIYLAGVPLVTSEDGGRTFSSISGDNVHADHHALWIDPNSPGHLINGNDGGINITYDDGDHWIKNNSPSVGQFYAINVDNQEPYHVYGGLQDNGVWEGPHNAAENSRWHQSGQFPWKAIMGGDGMQVQIDNRNHNTVYTGFQFGNYFRINKETKKQKYIQPKHELGETPYRFNWQTPILLSPHNQDILYLGGNKLHRSLDQGDTWEVISPDLTQGAKKGNVAYGTLTTISESPFKFGLVYTGSDDGLVQRTTNGGGDWQLLSTSLPKNLWVSRVAASKHSKERVYMSLNGYRWDDFTPYVYKSEDQGTTWTNIARGIPASPVNVILEDPENENLLFVGTDNGLYVSFDRGSSWEVFQNGIPNVAIHDLVIQKEAKHLLVGTHGRGIYKADISKLQEITKDIVNSKLHLFGVANISHSPRWGNARSSWSKPQTPGLDLIFYCSKATTFTAVIATADGIMVSETQTDADNGLNILSYDLAFSKAGKSAYLKRNKKELTTASDGKTYLPKGEYTATLKGNGSQETITFAIE